VRSHAKASSAGSISGGPSSSATGSGAHSNRARASLLALAGLVLVLLTLTSSAIAFTTRYPQVASFGVDGTAGTTFNTRPIKIAFHQASDRLYVLNSQPAANRRIYGFNASSPGTYTPLGGSFPLIVDPSGSFPGLAVDNTVPPSASAGNLYHVSTETRKIYGFNSAGTPLGGNFPISVPSGPKVGFELCGAAVDSAGSIYVSDLSLNPAAIRKYDSLGNPLGTIDVSSTNTGVCDIAFDSNDDMFVASNANVPGNIGGVWKLPAPSYSTLTKIVFTPTDAIAVDTVAHRLYASHSTSVSAYGTDGTPLYEFASGIAGVDFSGITVDEGTDTVYISDFLASDKVYAYGPAQNFADATAVPSAAASITDSGATIGATITDNNILPTNWRLELSPDQGASWNIVSSGTTAGSQSGVTVSKTLSGLVPNSSYRFRVVTNKGISAATEIVSSPLFFKTVAPPPVISDVGAVEIGDKSARMVGTIDPRNTHTGYLFEYGTTPALGFSTAPLDIGGGTTPITVSQLLGDLSPDTTYYFRLVATNLTGTTSSQSKTFHTRAAPLPSPANRGWEMVTPPDKNYNDAESIAGGQYADGRAAASLDGNAIGFCTTALFGDPPSQMSNLCAPYISRRGPGGWHPTNSTFPDYCRFDAVSGDPDGTLTVFPSADFSRVLFRKPEYESCQFPSLDPAAPLVPNGRSNNLYLQDAVADPSNFDLLNTQPGGEELGVEVIGGSDDFSHVVYRSRNNQTPHPGDSPAAGDFDKLYEWDNGILRLVSRDPSNVPFTTHSNPPTISPFGFPTSVNSGVSRDGRRIFFQNQTTSFADCRAASCDLYMREDGADTLHVSASECTASCGSSQADQFMLATPSGEKALFASCAKLTDASSVSVSCNGRAGFSDQPFKLYRWDRTAPPGHRLIDLSIDNEPADGTQPSFLGAIGQSDDGDTVYFVTAGQIVSGEPTFKSDVGVIGGYAIKGAKLYRWRHNGGNPAVDYLGPYQGLASGNALDINQWLRSSVTPDGKHIMLYSAFAYDMAADRDADADAYRWDEQGGWACLSCQLPSAPSGGDVDLHDVLLYDLLTGFYMTIASTEPRFFISEDGQRAFFGTPDALVAEDVNGEGGCPLVKVMSSSFVEGNGLMPACMDVYEWHDGAVNLVSSGISEHPARLMFSTPSGNDVFFYTAERLVGWDTDNNVDIYDARIGGGFPEPPPQPAPCEGESCRVAGTGTPATTGAGTAAFQGPGNPKVKSPEQGCPKGKRKARRGGKVRCVATKRKSASKRKGKRAQRRAANDNRRGGR
jgi:hypothetical protein